MTPPSPFDPIIKSWIIRGSLLALTVLAALLLTVLASDATQLEYLKLALDAAKLVVVGFLIAYLGILVPSGFSEARNRFEKLKAARIAFSRAKTGVDYLSLRLAVVSLEEASKLIQQLHVWKHRAELYPEEVSKFLDQRKESMSPKQWADLMYEQLHAVRDALERNADVWRTMSLRERIAELRSAQEAGIRIWKQDNPTLVSQPAAAPR